EEVISAVAEETLGTTKITYQGRTVDLTPPYRRVRLLDVVSEAVGEVVTLDRPNLRQHLTRYGVESQDYCGNGKLVFELFEEVGEERLWEPTFVTHYPTEVSRLGARNREESRRTDRFELYIAGSESANAFT